MSVENTMIPAFEHLFALGFDNTHFWRKEGSYFVVRDTTTHSIYRVPFDGHLVRKDVRALLNSSRGGSLLTCGAAHEL
jgi:hypothetical protein